MSMKAKLGITLALAAGAFYVTFSENSVSNKDDRLGTTVFHGKSFEKVDRIQISKGGKTLSLHKGKNGNWSLPSEGDFPADVAKIVRLVDDLGKFKFDQFVEDSKEALADYGLNPASVLELKTGDSSLLKLNLGSNRERGGVYFSIGDETKIFLSSVGLTAYPDASSWELKKILDLPPDQIQAITVKPPGEPAFTMLRADKDSNFALDGLKDGEANSAAVGQHLSVGQGVAFNVRHDVDNAEAKSALGTATETRFQLFDGSAITVRVGSVGTDSKKYFLSVTSDPEKISDPKLKEQIERLLPLVSANAFEIPGYLGQRYTKTRNDFVESAQAAGEQKKNKNG